MSELSAQRLAEAIAGLPAVPPLAASAYARMGAHWTLLQRWNRRANLTAVSEAGEAAALLYGDSLAACGVLPAGRCVDVGSGGGFPGIPLAIARPDVSFCLLEPRRKRASFLRVAVQELDLANVRVHCGRAEEPAGTLFESAVTKAAFSTGDGLRLCELWVGPGGLLVAYRAEGPPEIAGSRTQHYQVMEHRRMLEIWRRPVEAS